MFARCVLLIMGISGVAHSQLSGRLYLEKETFAPGEPVFLYYEGTNTGADTVRVSKADPYSFCSGYQIHVSSDEKPQSSCTPRVFAVSCLSSTAELKPGEKLSERILLNFEHKIDAPGDYDIQVDRSLSYADAREGFYKANNPALTLHAQLHVRIDPSADFDSRALDGFVAHLHSTDAQKRMEGARMLAALAPKSQEETLLQLADDPVLKQFAPLAFHRLNTPRSMAALADLLRKSEVGTYEHMESARYLGESGDLQWFPLLLEVAQNKPTIVNYLDYAAENDGEKMLPYLLAWMESPDVDFKRPNAVSAMGSTGSRDAVPVLIELLKSSDLPISQRALWGLRKLTHFSIAGDHWLDQPQAQYSRWLQWWAHDGASAHIYKAQECGDIRPLP